MTTHRIATILISFAVVAFARDVCASILAPDYVFDLQANGVSVAVEKSGMSSSVTRCPRVSRPPVPRTQDEGDRHVWLASNASLSELGSSNSLAGGSAPSLNGGSGTPAIDSTRIYHVDDILVDFLRNFEWLEIPTPIGYSILRPPQVI